MSRFAPGKIDTLDEISRDFIAYIAEHRPGWLDHAVFLRDESTHRNDLELIVPDPSGFTPMDLIEITTWGEEVTVSYAGQHRHFPWPDA